MTESSHSTSSRAPGARWIGLGILAALAIGVAAAIRGWAPPSASRPATPAPLGTSSPHAAAQTPPLSPSLGTSDKDRWVEEVSGASVADLDPHRREIFLRFVNAERCTCGCGYTLAGCRAYDPTCEVSLPRVTALLDSVRRGRITEARGVRSRPPGTGRVRGG